MNDERDSGFNTRIFIWDFTQVMTPTLMGVYKGPTAASDHNIWVDGNFAYVGNFRAGIRILDLRAIDQGQLHEAAYFDIYPEDDNTGHSDGVWAAYVYFGQGLIALSDQKRGLFLLQARLDQQSIFLPLLLK